MCTAHRLLSQPALPAPDDKNSMGGSWIICSASDLRPVQKQEQKDWGRHGGLSQLISWQRSVVPGAACHSFSALSTVSVGPTQWPRVPNLSLPAPPPPPSIAQRRVCAYSPSGGDQPRETISCGTWQCKLRMPPNRERIRIDLHIVELKIPLRDRLVGTGYARTPPPLPGAFMKK